VSSEALHRVAHMPPKWRRSISALRGELPTVTGYVLPKVEAGKIRAPASFAGVGNLTKDAGEAAQAVLPTLKGLRRRHELTGQNLVLIDERGDCGSAP
jgi:hypothetical protein